jgi:glycosyltransferase involved in cell wall biosynthesis
VRDDVADLLCAADALVVPSRWEGLGSILIEAMAMGTPVVTTAAGPIPDVVGTGWARVVPPEDPAALARAVIATVRQSPDECRHRGEIARSRFAASFTIAATADAMVAFYERALA